MLSTRRLLIAGSIVVLAALAFVIWHFGTPVEQFTYVHDVEPILKANCVACHRPGDAAPFSLQTYDEVKSRAGQIADVTQSRFMPPWLPVQGHEVFDGARKLSDREIHVLRQWAESGSPRGGSHEPPPTPVPPEEWRAGPPDLILETPAFTLASQERDVFRNFVLPIKLVEPRWVESIELQPLNPRATHHARLGVDNSNESVRRDAEDPEPGYAGMAWGQDPDGQLVVWTPGMTARPGIPGIAWRLFPQSCLVLHAHLQPTGKRETVAFRVGIRFATNTPQRHPAILRIGNCDVDIPAGKRRHEVEGRYTLPVDLDVYSIFPHAHSLCREVRVEAELPDGKRTPLVTITKFDENWHDFYRYRQPIRLPRGTRLYTLFVYDNSEGNVRNRSRPPRRTIYGSSVIDEMGDVYLQVMAVRPDQRAALMEHYQQYELQEQLVGRRKALEEAPNDPWRQELLAAGLLGAGFLQDGITLLERRVKTGPTEVFPIASLGLALTAVGEPLRGEAYLRRALVLDDKYPMAWLGLGKSLAAQQKWLPAEEAIRKAVALAPGMIEARLSLTDVLLQRGELDQAATACTEALAGSSDPSKVHLKLAEIRGAQKRYDESLEHCRAAKLLAPQTHPPLAMLAVYCNLNGDSPRAAKYLQEARAEAPDHPMPLLVQGRLARQRSDWPAVREALTAAVARPLPDNWPASQSTQFLAMLHSERYHLAKQLNDRDLARDALNEWLKVDPGNPQLIQMNFDLLTGTIP